MVECGRVWQSVAGEHDEGAVYSGFSRELEGEFFFQVPKSTAKSITKFFLQKSTTKTIAKSIADGRLQIVDYKRSITAY